MASKIEALRAQVEEKLNRRNEALEEARLFKAYGYTLEASDRRYEAQVLLNEVADLEQEIAEAEAYALSLAVEDKIEVEVEDAGAPSMTSQVIYQAINEAQASLVQALRRREAYEILSDETWAQVEALEAEADRYTLDDTGYEATLEYAYEAHEEAWQGKNEADNLVERLEEEIDLLRRLLEMREARGV